ncbi:hypothetical protein Slala03_40100 [Streptomyces lavendulae subsp. lavendulae]|nr:hypothetical protein Slala03_40100 [Streptomyces lavendulae subsp. lavendulae]
MNRAGRTGDAAAASARPRTGGDYNRPVIPLRSHAHGAGPRAAGPTVPAALAVAVCLFASLVPALVQPSARTGGPCAFGAGGTQILSNEQYALCFGEPQDRRPEHRVAPPNA